MLDEESSWKEVIGTWVPAGPGTPRGSLRGFQQNTLFSTQREKGAPSSSEKQMAFLRTHNFSRQRGTSSAGALGFRAQTPVGPPCGGDPAPRVSSSAPLRVPVPVPDSRYQGAPFTCKVSP